MAKSNDIYSKYFGENWTIYQDVQKLKDIVYDLLIKNTKLYKHIFTKNSDRYIFITDTSEKITSGTKVPDVCFSSGPWDGVHCVVLINYVTGPNAWYIFKYNIRDNATYIDQDLLSGYTEEVEGI